MPKKPPDADLTQDVTIVLAAGEGRRMGGPKALMSVRGTPWWQRQLKGLRDLGINQVWVVSPRVHGELLGEEDRPISMHVADSSSPMFASIIAGLAGVKPGVYRGVFILPIDVPVPGRRVWEKLSESNSCAVPVASTGRGHPVYLPSGWVDSNLRNKAGGPNARLDEIVRDDLIEVPVEDPNVTWNLNTRADVVGWLDASGARGAV